KGSPPEVMCNRSALLYPRAREGFTSSVAALLSQGQEWHALSMRNGQPSRHLGDPSSLAIARDPPLGRQDDTSGSWEILPPSPAHINPASVVRMTVLLVWSGYSSPCKPSQVYRRNHGIMVSIHGKRPGSE